MQAFSKYLRGYLVVNIRKFSGERFLNLCIKRNIVIWDLRNTNDGFTFKISIKDFKRLRPIAKKTKTRPRIVKRRGLPFQINKYKHRKAFAFGIIVAIITLYMFSLFIWNISVTGTSIYDPSNIIHFLENENIRVGTRINKVNSSELEKKILYNFQDVAWVSVEVSGTKLMVNLIETTEHPQFVKNQAPCDILAMKSGIITKIVTRKGTPMVKIGDVVKQNDILFSGTVNILTDGEITGVKYVPSDADIYAKTIMKYSNSINLAYEEKIYTNENTTAFGLFFGNYDFYLYHPKIRYDNYEIESKSKQLKLWGDYYLPIGVHNKNYIDYDIVHKTYTNEEAEAILQESLAKYLETLEKKGVQIVENNVKIAVDHKKATAIGNLILIESIGYPSEINN